jgi:predicted transcriptional regulator
MENYLHSLNKDLETLQNEIDYNFDNIEKELEESIKKRLII